MIDWKIINMERHVIDGFVSNVHWQASITDVNDTEEVLTSTHYGSVGLEREEERELIPFEELTEELVLTWVKDILDVEMIEESLNADIEFKKNPKTAFGTPWNSI